MRDFGRMHREPGAMRKHHGAQPSAFVLLRNSRSRAIAARRYSLSLALMLDTIGHRIAHRIDNALQGIVHRYVVDDVAP